MDIFSLTCCKNKNITEDRFCLNSTYIKNCQQFQEIMTLKLMKIILLLWYLFLLAKTKNKIAAINQIAI
jgi:hypothetical protein